MLLGQWQGGGLLLDGCLACCPPTWADILMVSHQQKESTRRGRMPCRSVLVWGEGRDCFRSPIEEQVAAASRAPKRRVWGCL